MMLFSLQMSLIYLLERGKSKIPQTEMINLPSMVWFYTG